jgi:tRNA(Ile)-lysidine synthase
MHRFVRSLITEWRKLELPFADDSIVVAVSGGADSMSLIAAIDDLVKRKKIRASIVVAHFNHRLRGAESDADERFVAEYTGQTGFEFVSGSTWIPKKGNLEQAAREVRYKFLEATAKKRQASIVLTAHTQNDQAETFLMNLIRGSGPAGLAAMKTIRPLSANVRLVRPLLSWAMRADTETFCRDTGVAYRADRMNDDQRFSRVRVRKTILPMLAEMNPRIVETIARAAELLDPEEVVGPAMSAEELKVSDLRSLPKTRLYLELRAWLRSCRGSTRALGRKHIEAIERLICSDKSGRMVELPGRGQVLKRRGRLTFTHIKVEK